VTALNDPGRMIDTHQHLWVPTERSYAWLEDAGSLNADFGPERVEADLVAAGITDTVLVQAADSYEDTFYMLGVAAHFPRVSGVIAWLPLDRMEESLAALEVYAASPIIRGIRVLNHDYADPRWLLRDDVSASIALLAQRGLALDVVSVNSQHLEMIAELADRHPQLTIVLDHLAKPDIAGGGWQPWADLLADAATRPNLSAKLSGLNTASSPGWTAENWQPYVDHAVTHFGSARLMLGSDWPVSTLNGDFGGVWRGLREVIAGLSDDEQRDILFRTAVRTYALEGLK
jgi:L-fuconolactonase